MQVCCDRLNVDPNRSVIVRPPPTMPPSLLNLSIQFLRPLRWLLGRFILDIILFYLFLFLGWVYFVDGLMNSQNIILYDIYTEIHNIPFHVHQKGEYDLRIKYSWY